MQSNLRPEDLTPQWYHDRPIPERLLRKMGKLPIINEMDMPPDGGASAATLVSRMREERLTKREKDVLNAISHGLEMSMAAEVLNVTEETVKTHLKNIRYVLKAKTTLHAVAIALRKGIIE